MAFVITHQVEDQVFVVGRGHALPLQEQEGRDHRVLQEILKID
jgi:hypothetical protein